MTETKRCICCHGSGKIEGGGFQKKECDECKGIGRIPIIDDEIALLAAKQKLEATQTSVDDSQKLIGALKHGKGKKATSK